MQNALLRYHTVNLGDDIQTACVRRLLPENAHYVYTDRDRLAEERRDLRMVLHGWFLHGTCWPPSDTIRPLITSFCIGDEASLITMKNPESLAYLRKHGPIGCRDGDTLLKLKEMGVDAYLSGCVSLTLPRNDESRRGGHIEWVDVSLPYGWEHFTAKWPGQIRERVRGGSHAMFRNLPVEKRATSAEYLLERYRTASLVVTSRVHAALPAIAMGTPVVFIHPYNGLSRLVAFFDLFPHMYAKIDVETNAIKWWRDDWLNPPPSVDDHRQEMTERIREFFA